MSDYETYHPVYECRICAQRRRRIDLETKALSPDEAIAYFQKSYSWFACIYCYDNMYGITELVGVFTQ